MRSSRPSKPLRRRTLENAVDHSPDLGMTDAEIRKRAYALYLTRKGAYGDALEDWLQAERELRGQAGGWPEEDQP